MESNFRRITPEDRAALNSIFLQTLQPATIGIAVLFVVFIFRDFFTQPADIVRPLILFNALIAGLLLAIHALARRGVIPPDKSHQAGFAIVASILANNFYSIWVQQHPVDSINTLLILIGVGCFFLSGRCLAAVYAFGAVGWGALALLMPDSALWRHFGLGIFAAIVLGALIYKARVRAYLNLERARRDDQARKEDLEEALGSAKNEISEREKVQAALRESEERYRRLVDLSPVPIVVHAGGRLLFVNRAGLKQLGAESLDSIIGRSILDYVYPDDHAMLRLRDERLLRDPHMTQQQLIRVFRPGGEIAEVETSAIEIQYGGQQAIQAVLIDVTQRRKDEAALRKVQEELKAKTESLTASNRQLSLMQFAIDHAADPIFWVAADGLIAYANAAACQVYGYTIQEMLGLKVYEIVADLTPDQAPDYYRQIKAKRSLVLQRRHRRKDGTVFPTEVTLTHFKTDGRSYVMVFARDISERLATEEALRSSEERYRQLVDRAPVGIAVHRDGKFLFLNKTAARLGGVESPEELVAQSVIDFIHPDHRELAIQRTTQILTEHIEPPLTEMKLLNRDGKTLVVEMTGVPVVYQGEWAVQSIYRDITERKESEEEKQKLETQLIQAQKMEAIGNLAGGVAHDFNNLLAGILGYADLLKLEADSDSSVWRAADVIERAAERASELTRQLLGFARKGKLQNTPVDIHATIDEVVALLERTLDKRIKIQREFKAESHFVMGDPSQLQQVVLNLAVNARDAMPEGGRLTFQTEITALSEDDCRQYAGTKPGVYLLIAIADTGAGIPKEIQHRVFEPFFTTKEQGKGTGMGLAMVYGIVKNHTGAIHVRSEPGEGTRFLVFLPITAAPEPPTPVPQEPEKVVRGKGRILVVDDEEFIRFVATDMLELLGYDVVTATDGKEAVDLYAESFREIDLAIIDMIMPNMGGRETFRALKAINPGVRAILSSGYSRDGAVQEILDEGMLGFAQKPYHMHQLSEIISRAMN